jgi:mono/diheme cytochrome c family protein
MRRLPLRWMGIGLTVGVSLALLVFRKAPSAGSPVVINDTAVPPVPTLNPDRVAQGAALYAENCARCHGANLEGAPDWKRSLPDGSLPPPPHDRSGHTWHHPDTLLLDIIANGGNPAFNSKMPAFKNKLSEEEMRAILAFIKSKWGKDEQEFQWWMTATVK